MRIHNPLVPSSTLGATSNTARNRKAFSNEGLFCFYLTGLFRVVFVPQELQQEGPGLFGRQVCPLRGKNHTLLELRSFTADIFPNRQPALMQLRAGRKHGLARRQLEQRQDKIDGRRIEGCV